MPSKKQITIVTIGAVVITALVVPLAVLKPWNHEYRHPQYRRIPGLLKALQVTSTSKHRQLCDQFLFQLPVQQQQTLRK